MSENRTQEEKLIKKLIPKITEFFKKHEKLEKEKVSAFMEFIDLSILDENNQESFWNEISKNSNGKNIQKVLLVRNLTEYIHNHSKELFQPQESLNNSVIKFLERPVKLIEDIDADNELMYEFYRLLAIIEFSNSQSIPLFTLENIAKEYQFINLNKDNIKEIIEELLKEKATSIKKNDYLEIMEKMDKEYKFRLSDMAQKKLIFTDEELDNPELENFFNLLTFVNILLKISDSVIICHEKNIQGVKNNEVLSCEYFNRSFKVLVNNMKLYFYEIMRIYYEQKQKFDYFACSNVSKLTILRQQNKDLSDQLKAKDEDEEQNNNNNILKALYEELNVAKNKLDGITKENEQLKKDYKKKDEELIEYNNKLIEENKAKKEIESKLNIINKENELQKEKYKNVFEQLNAFIYINKEKEKKFNESISKLNLNKNILPLVNMEKEDIIHYINERDKYYEVIEENNNNLRKKINELENIIKKNEKEIYDLKNLNSSLKKKNEMIEKELEDNKKELEERNEKSFFLSNLIDDKIDKEDYDEIEQQLNKEKEKNKNLKVNIEKLNEEISKKEEEIIKNKNLINSQEINIKENINKINKLNEKIEKSNKDYSELLNKYKNYISQKEESERKINEGIKNLNLSEQYKKLINLEKPELIKLILEKDKNITKLENKNYINTNKINELEKINQINNNELQKNKLIIDNLNKKIDHLEKEINNFKNEKENLERKINDLKKELQKEKIENERLISVEKDLEQEKNKNNILLKENTNLKNENLSQNENIIKSKNKISLLQNKIKENEDKINSILNEKDLLNKNYSDLMNKYNEQLTNTQQKEKQASEAIKNLNLTGNYIKLANMSKDQLISLIIEKDKYLNILENSKKDLNDKIEKITKEKNIIENELNNLKASFSTLEKKNSIFNNENEQMKKELENNKVKKNNLLRELQNEKAQKENYKKDSDELKEAQKRIKVLKNDIQKLSDENLSKEEKIMEGQKKILSLNNKINELLKEKEEIIKNYNELLNKSNLQEEKIKLHENEDKNEQDLINNLNLSDIYKSYTNMNKAKLIAIIIEKDNLFKKIEELKNNLEQKISNIEKVKNELEKNLSEFEIKNNTLSKKNEVLNGENISLKNENEKLDKEKSELYNMLKEEKKLVDKMKNQNELLNKENNKIEILTNENKKLKEDLLKKDEYITKSNNKMSLDDKKLKNKDEKILNLSKEIEILKNQYKDLFSKYNEQLLNVKNKEKQKEDALKNLDDKYKFLFNLPIEELIKLIIEKDKINSELQEENRNIINKNNNLIERNKKLEDFLNKCKNLKQKYENLKETCMDLTKTCEEIKKERDEYIQKYDKLIESLVKKDKEQKIFKTNSLGIIKSSQLMIKRHIIKKPKPINGQIIKKYDYLCIGLNQLIIESLEDKLYDPRTVFTESIKYIDQQNETSDECILFITQEYFYLFNWKYKKCFSIPLVLLSLINISKSNNYVSLIFLNGNIVIIELFRVLELINYLKLIQAQQKYNFSTNSEPYIYDPNKSSNNFIESIYYGKAYFSGYLSKKSEGIFIDKYEDRFGVLCEIGLIILDSPTGKPKEIINLLFADIFPYNSQKGKTGLVIEVGDHRHRISFESEDIREEWEQRIKYWKKNFSVLTKFN